MLLWSPRRLSKLRKVHPCAKLRIACELRLKVVQPTESIGVQMTISSFLLLVSLLHAQGLTAKEPTTNLNGGWIASFQDSIGWGEVELDLQEFNSKVSGNYRTSQGGKGRLNGTFVNGRLAFDLDQNIKNCRGLFRGSGSVNEDAIEGTYAGADCRGSHVDGKFVMLRRGGAGYAALRNLVPILGPGQRIIQEGKNRLVLVESERFKVVAGVVALPMLSVALVGVENKSDSPLSAEQARVFLLDSTSQPTYRFTDFELRLNLLNAAGVQMPPFQPPPPRPYYTIMGSSVTSYAISDMGLGYTSVTGFSNNYATVYSNYDYSAGLGYAIGYGIGALITKIREANRMRRAERQATELQQVYFKDATLQAGKGTGGVLFFKAPSAFPIRLIVFIGNDPVEFAFTRR